MELEDFLKLNEEEAINYDFKNEFEEELEFKKRYKEKDYLDKWLAYKGKATKLRIDCDVSKLASQVFVTILSNDPSINASLVAQVNCHKKYQIKLEDGSIFRLDSANSMFTTLKQALQFDFKEGARLNEEYWSICRNLKIVNNKGLSGQSDKIDPSMFINDEKVLKNFNEYAKLTHTIGNFLVYPYSQDKLNFNQKRGLNRKVQDYLDLTLLCIYYWYTKSDEENPLKNVLDDNKDWLNNFGKGQDGWSNFVKRNYLDDFVKKKGDRFGEPKMFFVGHSFKNPLLATRDGEKLDKEEFIKRLNHFLEFVNNAIRERGKKIYKDLQN